MASIVPGYEYDIFISYRQKDNKYDGWVTEFVDNLKLELEATFKEDISIYFDINPHDGIQESNLVDQTLQGKLKCLIFIPVISQTYCDPRSFAWQYELCAFNKMSKEDQLGRDIRLGNGNVASRILAVKIHELDGEDEILLEKELGGTLRSIEFIFMSSGVNRPLRAAEDHPQDNLNKTFYRDQMNKVANSVKALITGIQSGKKSLQEIQPRLQNKKKSSFYFKRVALWTAIVGSLALAIYSYIHFGDLRNKPDKEFDKSIAVLPFLDMSQDHNKEYFSDGMTEEILNHLYKIGELKVTSRTSSMQYKGETKKPIREIARELGVAHILEGSVRLQDNKVRITVQLIRAATDEHLWAENYDREFSDIFSIQSEVAQEVARALKARISDEVLRIMGSKPTTSTEAYDLVLKSNELSEFNEKENEKAISLCKKAIALDPEFSYAYEELGFRLTIGSSFLSTTKHIDPREAWQNAKPYFEKSLELNPDYAQAHVWMAWGLLWYEWDFAGSQKEYRECQRIYPNYSWTDYELASGHFEQAYKGALVGVDIDSRNFISWTSMITSAYFSDHDPHNAITKALNTPKIKDDIYVRSEIARIYMYLKEYDKAISTIKQLIKDFPDIDSPRLKAILAISYYRTNHSDETIRILEEQKQKSDNTSAGSPSFYSAMIYSAMGNTDLAFAWLGKACQNHEVEMYWLKVEPPFEPLRGDPRFQEMLDKVGF
jgi:TolB-like protein/tetratricopeptide (TPR) repeat protein